MDGTARGPLELRDEGGRLQYYLLDQAIRSGVEVEVLLIGDRWLRGVFEWTGEPHRWPGLRLRLGDQIAYGGYLPSLVAPLHPAAILRWPKDR